MPSGSLRAALGVPSLQRSVAPKPSDMVDRAMRGAVSCYGAAKAQNLRHRRQLRFADTIFGGVPVAR